MEKVQSINRYKKNRSSETLLFWFVIALVLWYMSACCETAEDLDLHRYYEDVERSYDLGLVDFINHYFSSEINFIYYTILYIAHYLSIPLNLVTGLIVTLTYALCISCVREIYQGKIEWYVLLVALLLAPITWVISISRSMTAIMFLYVACKMYYRRKWLFVFFFTIISVFTHVSALMYIVAILASCFLRNIHIKSSWLLLILSGVYFVSYLVPSYFNDIITLLVGGKDIVYEKYAEMGVETMSQWSTKGMGSLLPVIYGLLYSVVLLLLNRKQGIEFWILFLLTSMLFFFVNSSQMLSNRGMMVMPLFWCVNVASIYKYGTRKGKRIVNYLSLPGGLVVFWHIYSYRDMYFPFMY